MLAIFSGNFGTKKGTVGSLPGSRKMELRSARYNCKCSQSADSEVSFKSVLDFVY